MAFKFILHVDHTDGKMLQTNSTDSPKMFVTYALAEKAGREAATKLSSWFEGADILGVSGVRYEVVSAPTQTSNETKSA